MSRKDKIRQTRHRSYARKLKQRKAELAMRWDKIIVRARQMDCGNIGIGTLASLSGLEWYRARGDEPLANFLDFEGIDLMARRSLGFQKIDHLCEIVELALDSILGAETSNFTSAAIGFDPHETLVDWGIPSDYPCRLTRLPVRIINYCDKQGLTGIGELLNVWETLGLEGFKAQQNLGSMSVRRIEVFVKSLRRKDHKTASSFLPLDPSGNGLSLGSALKLIAAEPSLLERSLLDRRLVQRMTLETSAEESGLTRERVRQVEMKFLTEVSEILEYFSGDYARLLDAWIGIGNWTQQLQMLELNENKIFIAAALEAIFRDTPQAVARTLGEESRLENWHEELLSHPELWFGGVNLSEFLVDHVPSGEQQEFCEHVSKSTVLRLDHSDGRVHPARIGLRHAVVALLAGEDDPIPLTWLIKMLVRTGYHPSVTARDLLRRVWPGSKTTVFRQIRFYGMNDPTPTVHRF